MNPISARTLRLGGVLLILAACTAGEDIATAQGDAAGGTARIAQQFAEALNDEDVERLVGLTAAPFFFREQGWDLAPDGDGFVRMDAEDRTCPDAAGLRAFLEELVTRVGLEETEPMPVPPDLDDAHRAGAEPSWQGLEVHAFLRGLGDVEHVAVVGVEPGSGKVRALYVN
jgi:hypothetical protein